MQINELIKGILTALVVVLVIGASYGIYKEFIDPLAKVTFNELSQAQQATVSSSFENFAKRLQECRDKQSNVKCACKNAMIKLPLDLRDHTKIKIVKHVNNSEIDLLINDQSANINKSIKFTQFSYMNSKDSLPRTKELFVTEEIIDFKKERIIFYYFDGTRTKEIIVKLISPHIIKAAQYNSILSFAADINPDKNKLESINAEFNALPDC